MLKKIESNLLSREAEQTQKEVTETTAAMVFKLKETPDFAGGTAAFCLAGNLLAASDDVAVLQANHETRRRPGHQGRIAGRRTGFPGGNEALCGPCRVDAAARFVGFIQPLGYIEAMRATVPEDKRIQGHDDFKHFRATRLHGHRGAWAVL